MESPRHCTMNNLGINFIECFNQSHFCFQKFTSRRRHPHLKIEFLFVDIFSESDCDNSPSENRFENLSNVDVVRQIRRVFYFVVPNVEVILNFAFEYFHHDFELVFIKGVCTSFSLSFPNSITFAKYERILEEIFVNSICL